MYYSFRIYLSALSWYSENKNKSSRETYFQVLFISWHNPYILNRIFMHILSISQAIYSKLLSIRLETFWFKLKNLEISKRFWRIYLESFFKLHPQTCLGYKRILKLILECNQWHSGVKVMCWRFKVKSNLSIHFQLKSIYLPNL